jgi:hypothetical protein
MEKIGEVVSIKGRVVAESGQDARELSTGSPVHEGETIITGENGGVEIKFADGSVMAQGPESSMSLDEYFYDADGGSNMLFNAGLGVFRLVTGKISEQNPESVEIKTPMATIGIRGTGIDIFSLPDKVKVGCSKYEDFDVVITTQSGTTFLTDGNSLIEIFPDGSFGLPRPYSDLELYTVKEVVPIESIEGFFYEDGDPGDEDDDNGDGGDAGEDAPADTTSGPRNNDPFGDDGDGGDEDGTLLANLPGGDGGDGDDDEDGDGDGDDVGGEEDEDDDDDDTLLGGEEEEGEQGSGGRFIVGTDGPDTLRGGSGGDTITGGAGSDLLEGGGGNDLILPGTSPADTVCGGT